MDDSEKVNGCPSPEESQRHLDSLLRAQSLMHDRVIGVADGHYPGCFIDGPAGRGKTHEVLETLRRHGISPVYHTGHLTPIGLFELIESNADQVIVLDDVHILFHNPIAQQILLAALGKMDEHGTRYVTYRRMDVVRTVPFTGGLICISNAGLADIGGSRVPFIKALLSRIHSLEYSPTREQIIALLRYLIKDGWQSPVSGMSLTADQCHQVLEFTLDQCRQLGREPELRLVMDKALPDFAHWKQGETETHWEDLIRSSFEERTVVPRRETRLHAGLTRAHHRDREQAILQELLQQHDTAAARIAEFAQRTGKDRRTYYRRLKELEKTGAVDPSPSVDDADLSNE